MNKAKLLRELDELKSELFSFGEDLTRLKTSEIKNDIQISKLTNELTRILVEIKEIQEALELI